MVLAYDNGLKHIGNNSHPHLTLRTLIGLGAPHHSAQSLGPILKLGRGGPSSEGGGLGAEAQGSWDTLYQGGKVSWQF